MVPNKYEGLILVSKDEATGADFFSRNNTFTITIPENGEVSVKTFAPFTEWHRTRVYYANGDEIPYGDTYSNGAVAFNDLGFLQYKGINMGFYFFVGKQSDYDTVRHSFDLSVLPLGNKNLKAISPPSVK